MHRILSTVRIVAVIGLVASAFAACGESPTNTVAPDRARHDTGWWAGSGNSTDSTVTATDSTVTASGGWTGGPGD